jgi:selenocysteine lyase/cysteine desulfurase
MILVISCSLASDDIIVTAGATQGLAMLANLLFSPGDLVFVEDPTYFIGLQALRQDCGLQCVPGQTPVTIHWEVWWVLIIKMLAVQTCFCNESELTWDVL